MKRKSIVFLTSCIWVLLIFSVPALANHDVTQTAVLGDDCSVTFKNSISDSKQYASASTTTNKAEAQTTVSATYYILNTVTGESFARGNGNGGQAGCGVSYTAYGSEFFYKMKSSHIVVYQSLELHRNDMLNEVFP